MIEIFAIGAVVCAAALTGFVFGLFYRKVLEKHIADSYTAYLEELAESGKKDKGFDPHKNGSNITQFPKNK